LLLASLTAAPFLASPLVYGLARRGAAPLAWILPAALFALLIGEMGQGERVESHTWIPSLGIDLAFRLDGLSLVFAALILGIGSFIFLYGARYLRGDPGLARFLAVLTLFMGAMLGAVLADDLIVLIVFWELTSLTSFLLIGFRPEAAQTRRSAQQGLLVTFAGGLCLLAGALLLGQVAGTYSLTEIVAQRDLVAADPLAPAIIVLLALGAFAKSAQVPLHSWLANAMVAPTPVSAYLHSATMVKLGVYLLARINPLFDEDPLWIGLLTLAGAATMLVGALLALRETDLKRVLAYSTIVSLGTLVLLAGLPGPLASVALVAFLVVHALYKACLFLVAGIIDHEAGTRDSSRLGGLRRLMPLTAGAALLGGLSMAGLPPFVGFVAKELLYEASLATTASWLIAVVALLANAAMVVVAGVVAWRCFAGPLQPTPRQPHDPPWSLLAGPAVLALLGLTFGVAPWLVASTLVLPAASAIAGESVSYDLALWHGLTPMLALSALTLLLGLLGFHRWTALRHRSAALSVLDSHGPDAAYDGLLRGLQRLAGWQTARLQSGSLRHYQAAVLAIFAAAMLGTLLLSGGLRMPSIGAAAWQWETLLALPLALAAIAVVRARRFISGIVAAGVTGFSVALLFLFQGAPDLAFTQFSVEAIAIVILLAIVGRLPFREADRRDAAERRRDLVIAVALGVAASLVLLTVMAEPFDQYLSDYFRTRSVPEAQGRNIVNVIIVDFRALDTLGEITVLALAALAAAAVIGGLRAATLRRGGR